jgi:hypothetical protein
MIPFRQFNHWNFDVEAVCLTALGALEVDVLMAVLSDRAGLGA